MSSADEAIHVRVNAILYDARKLARFIERERRKNPNAQRVVLHLVNGREQVLQFDNLARELGIEVDG